MDLLLKLCVFLAPPDFSLDVAPWCWRWEMEEGRKRALQHPWCMRQEGEGRKSDNMSAIIMIKQLVDFTGL